MDNAAEIERLTARITELHAEAAGLQKQRRALGWKSREEVAADRKRERKARKKAEQEAYEQTDEYKAMRAEWDATSRRTDETVERGRRFFAALGEERGQEVLDAYRTGGIEAARAAVNRSA